MTSFDKQIVAAIIALVRANRGELHGWLPSLIDHIALEAFGPLGEEQLSRFTAYVRNMGLKYVLEDSPVALFFSTTGELNFVDRRLIDGQ